MMKNKLILAAMLIAGISLPGLGQTSPLALMPYPAELEQQSGYFRLPTQLHLTVQNLSENRAAKLKQQLQASLGVTFGHSDQKLQIEIAQSTPGYPALGEDESYLLGISEDGILIQAQTELGALRGAQTLRQLAFDHQGKLPFVHIQDSPRFPWRGLMIDSVRHFMPLEAIYRQLDGMASAKLNVFHWHLTDDQGWRLESTAYPKLQQLASDGLYYSREQIRQVVNYANSLGIRVVPEFDVPGHATAIAVAYPELISQPGPYALERHWGVFEPLLDPSNPEVYQFIDTLVAEIAELFPDPYLHIGGDEINPTQWQQSQKIQAYMQAHGLEDHHQLHTHFNAKVQKILARHGKKMMGWDEIFHADLPKDIMIQSWQGLDSLAQTAMAGYQGLLSTGFYIDQPQKTAYHYRNEPVPANDFVGPDWHAKSQWQHWQFKMPRLKGAAVSGDLVLIEQPDGHQQGYVRLNKQQTRMLKDVTKQGKLTRFWLDTWMGPMQFEVDLSDSTQLQGRILIGNSPYKITGTQLAADQGKANTPVVTAPSHFAPAFAENILGGEATIWSEMITGDNLDLRVWPRLYAIAERLWSVKTLTDEQAMYQRLKVMDDFATVVGLAHQSQQRDGFQALLDQPGDIQPLYTLADLLEQAQYYTRHHLKFQADAYHHGERLDRFVDYLPTESLALVALNQLIAKQSPGQRNSLQQVEQKFLAWQKQLPAVRALIAEHKALKPLAALIEDIEHSLTLGLDITKLCQAGPIPKEKADTLRQILWQLAEVKQEMVIGSAHSANLLLDRCLAS
ncbi:family 20 glycosylhydrolase [Bowmanella denitrificans]|uniref:family 20 glycosylhydrolase n=1 Tax=Bowmanella denitrificans TaxID=366582 RepID=UPI000C9C0B33|nr:family 20 glycosylhydrolase [Bowmanella denitrificans]